MCENFHSILKDAEANLYTFIYWLFSESILDLLLHPVAMNRHTHLSQHPCVGIKIVKPKA